MKYSQPDSALIFAQQALKLSTEINNKYQITNSINRVGVIQWIQGSYEEALNNIQKAHEYYIELNNERGVLVSYVNMGLINQNLGHYDESLKLLLNALRITDKNSDSTSRSTVLTNVGNTYYLMEDFDKAKRYYIESMMLKTKLGFTGTLHKTQMNLGVIYQQQNRLDSALYFYHKALNKAEELNDWKNIALSKANIGTIYHEQNELDWTIAYYRGAYDVYQSGSYINDYDMGILVTDMSRYYCDVNQFDSADYFANLALVNGKKAKNILMIRDAYEQISSIQQARSNFKDALVSYKQYISFRDSLYTIENKKDYDELLTRYETEKKERQLEIQGLIIDQQNAANERNIIIILALLIIVLLLIITGFLYKNRLDRRQMMLIQQKELEFKEIQLNAVIESQELERKRFSQDIHDGFGQLISVLKLNVQSIDQENDRDKRHAMFDQSVGVLNEMYGELKSICFNLMPQTLLNFGLVPTLKEFAERINRSGQVMVEVLSFDMDDRLSELQEISIYRIVQEWINNILKYGDANSVTVQLTKDESELTLLIEDNGMGWNTDILSNGSGNGWKNIRSRANLIKAELELDSQTGNRGTTLILNIPIVEMKTKDLAPAE